MDRELHLKLTVRLYADDDTRCFGPGIATLLHRVEEHKSLRAAAASMGMAYSKARRIIRTAEAVFDRKLLDSTIGGRHGGGAVLTEDAQRLLAAYDRYRADLEAYARSRFRDAFGDWAAMHETGEGMMEVRITGTARNVRFFALQYGPSGCEVLRPESLRRQLLEDARAIAAVYDPKPDKP